jgi:hypothetical protein
MTESPLGKAAGLPQGNAVWQATARRAPVWITPKKQPPYRPYIIMVADATTDRVRQSSIEEDRPTAQRVLSVVAEAMLNPIVGGGKRCRPARLLVDSPELVQTLAEPLAGIGIRCEHQATLPQVNALLRQMDAHMNRREPRPGLLSVPGVTQPLVAEFFAAAADFYRRAVWRWMDNLQVLAVRYPADSPPRYIVILGNGGEEFGLALYPSLDALRVQFSDLESRQSYKKITAMSITFDEPTALAFEDLDALDQHGWEIAGPQAFPVLLKITPPSKVSVPGSGEIALLAAALRAIPDFVVDELRADRGRPRPAQATYPLPNVHANQQIALSYPVDLPELKALQGQADLEEQDTGEELEEFIHDWYYDEPSHQFARDVGAFLFQFLDDLAVSGISEKTLGRHEENCWLIGKFTCDYSYAKAFSPALFLGGPGYLPEFKRKVTSAKSAIAAYETTWRKLEGYVRAMGYGEGSRPAK